MNLRPEALRGLVGVLQHAHAGELAAGLAYRGHAASVSDPAEKARIRQIEDEEWVHRRQVGEMIACLGEAPEPSQERKLLFIGQTIAFLCRIGGWYVPMYGAGRLESHNVKEYEDAAYFAVECGHPEFVECLLEMAEVEWERAAGRLSETCPAASGRRPRRDGARRSVKDERHGPDTKLVAIAQQNAAFGASEAPVSAVFAPEVFQLGGLALDEDARMAP